MSAQVRTRAAGATVWYLRLVAVLNVVGLASVPFRSEIHEHNVGELFTPYLATSGLVSTVLALFLAVVMRRRKRAAWTFNLLLSAPLFALNLLAMTQQQYRVHPFNWASLVLTGGFVAALLTGRGEFQAARDRTETARALAVLAGGVLAAAGIGTLLVSSTNEAAGASMGDRIAYTLLRGVTVGPLAGRFPHVQAPPWVDLIINALTALAFALVLLTCFRSPRGRRLLSPEDENDLRGLLAEHGDRDSLGYFALRRDKSVVFSPSRKAAIAYRVVGGVSLASGDPLGDREAWPGAIEEWLRTARRHAWVPAVTGAGEEAGTVYSRHGFDALELGDEALVDSADFTLQGRAMRGVRQAHNRVHRAGYTVRIRRHREIPSAEMAHVVERADRWRDGESERGFSMALGRLGDPSDGDCLLLECLDAEGAPRGMLSFVPWGEKRLSLDLMRRDREADNGLMEFMIVELFRHASELGIIQVSLNFAVFRSVFARGARLGAGPVLRLWRAVLTFFSRWWQIESLYRANAKYRPVWEPRYLMFEKSSEVPRIGLAYARAEGFLEAPALLTRSRRRTEAVGG